MVSWVISAYAYRTFGHADTDIPQVNVVRVRLFDEAGEQGIIVGEADPISFRGEDMNMRAAPQSPRYQGQREGACFQIFDSAWSRYIDENPLSMCRAILPVRRGIFRTEDKDDLLPKGAKRRHTTMRPIHRPI